MPEISPALYRAGEGEPLVLLHGFTGTWHHWRPVLGDLVARFEVIAPTLAGHDGGPPFPASGPLTLAQGADALEQHLDELGVGTAHFAGNSMGGAFSLEMAKRGRARSVIALSPGAGWAPGDPEALRIANFFVRTQRLAKASLPQVARVMKRPGARKLALRDAMRHGELMPPADAIDMVRTSVHCDVVDDVIRSLRGPSSASITDLDQVSCPTLVAWGQHDRILPMERHMRRFRNEIPGVEFRVLPGCGHVPMWDNTRLVADTIAGWVAKHASVSEPAAA
jgi:pimeloyl-ACP methyl ester carboxylesterase